MAFTGLVAPLIADDADDEEAAEEVPAEEVDDEESEVEADEAEADEAEAEVDAAAELWEVEVVFSASPPDEMQPLMPDTIRNMSNRNTMAVAIIVFHWKRSTRYR